jgi:hydroxymethylpyrimidine/phosphomethylpyrimidine kinase
MRSAAQKIHSQWGCAVLLKGGHLKNLNKATDLFFDGAKAFYLSAPFVKVRTHGTGCVYSAAICGALALGKDLPEAVRMGKRLVTKAIGGSYRIGRHFGLET